MIAAAGCAALAAWLSFPPRPAATRRAQTVRVPGTSWAVIAAVLLATAVALLPGRAVALTLLLATAGGAGWRLWRLRARRLAAASESVRVLEACDQLAAELAAGQPPGVALQRIAADCPLLAPAAEAFTLGADVPVALREAAATPGAEDLRWVAAGWQVAHRTGAGLAGTLERIAASLREEQTTRRLVEGELASARATARLVAALPLLALAMGSGAGGSPWRFLLTTSAGLASLAGGLALGLAGLWWIESLTGRIR
jgi:tight adherence protein B